MAIRKYVVLGILFLLPVAVYMFFASGVHHFNTLPVLTTNVHELSEFEPSNTQLENKISITGFLGDNPGERALSILNMNQKIYRRFYKFDDFQFIMVCSPESKKYVQILTKKLGKQTGTDASKWQFVFGDESSIKSLFNSLQSPYKLDSHLGSDKMFIIDKKRQLRGRNDKEGKLYGYNATSGADINNTMVDDVKILLAEYRLELKKNKKSRRNQYLKKLNQ